MLNVVGYQEQMEETSFDRNQLEPWKWKEPIHWRYRFHRYIRPMCQAYGSGNIPRIHMAKNMVRLRSSILRS